MFYVYTLTDPRDQKVFYVGKGKGARIAAHEREAAQGACGAKCERIRDIWLDGASVQRSKVASFSKEIAALFEEERLIAEIGLKNLTNIAPGGRGGRHKRKPSKWTEKMLIAIAPNLRRVFGEMASGNGRLYACGQDITRHIGDLVDVLRREVGEAALTKHTGATFGPTNQVQNGVCGAGA